ncbi:MAG: glycosyltransferase [Verrucomicrobia bacterium]|nr:glycosyltransferase [Verrucomicrobiota bacterium]
MRILHLLGAREDDGGILTVLRNLHALELPGQDRHVVWVHRAYRESRRPALEYRRSRFLVAQSPNHLALLLRAPLALLELRALLAREPFDVLHAHTRGALLVAVGAARWLGRTVWFTNHAYARRRSLYRWAARQPRVRTSVLTPNMARHYGLPWGAAGVRVISECCSDRLFAEPLVERSPRTDGRPLRCVGLGNIVRWKNWHLLLEALGQLDAGRRARCEFHHWGPVPADADCAAYDRELRALVARHGLEGTCHFHGLSLDAPAVLRGADLFVLPSTQEPCSVALIEALALGIPGLVSASGGNVDIVEAGRTGLLFEPESAASLRTQLERVLAAEPPFAAPAEIRASVSRRSSAAVAAQYAEWYLSGR